MTKKPLKDKLNELPPVRTSSELDEKLLELNSDQRVALLRKENDTLRNKLNKKDAGWDIVKTAFEQAYDEDLRIEIIPPRKSTKKKYVEEAVLHLTDVHIGKQTLTYNSTVAAERIISTFQSTEEIVKLRRNFATIDKLHLLLGGDLIEGEGNIFPGQAHEIDQDLIEQCIKEGPNYIANLILSLLELFPNIVIKGVPGNHGRTGRFNPKRNNSDSIFYEIVRLIVNRALTPKDQKRVEWDLPFDRPNGSEWYAQGKFVDTWGYLLVHGDQIRGALGFPWYGYGKKVAGWASHLDPWDYLFAGHFHTHASFDIQDREVLSTGSMESDNAYALENMAAAGSPKQRLCFINKSRGLIDDSRIHLEERKPHK